MWVKVKDGCGEGVQLDHWLLLEQEEEEQMNVSPRGWLGGQQLSVSALLPETGGKVVGREAVVGKDDGDSSRSLIDEVPPFDEIVKVAHSPASSSSSNNLKILMNLAFILSPDI